MHPPAVQPWPQKTISLATTGSELSTATSTSSIANCVASSVSRLLTCCLYARRRGGCRSCGGGAERPAAAERLRLRRVRAGAGRVFLPPPCERRGGVGNTAGVCNARAGGGAAPATTQTHRRAAADGGWARLRQDGKKQHLAEERYYNWVKMEAISKSEQQTCRSPSCSTVRRGCCQEAGAVGGVVTSLRIALVLLCTVDLGSRRPAARASRAQHGDGVHRLRVSVQGGGGAGGGGGRPRADVPLVPAPSATSALLGDLRLRGEGRRAAVQLHAGREPRRRAGAQPAQDVPVRDRQVVGHGGRRLLLVALPVARQDHLLRDLHGHQPGRLQGPVLDLRVRHARTGEQERLGAVCLRLERFRGARRSAVPYAFLLGAALDAGRGCAGQRRVREAQLPLPLLKPGRHRKWDILRWCELRSLPQRACYCGARWSADGRAAAGEDPWRRNLIRVGLLTRWFTELGKAPGSAQLGSIAPVYMLARTCT
ncbi:hypothetical protein ON010_g12951 [Phytophthora cinnamomi]|nr:hypothetical protein ON010_g12951 [Phytophthora cinnamomi]